MSYFDNQYGGEDEDNKFNAEDASEEEEEVSSEEGDATEEELEGGDAEDVESELDDELEDEDDEEGVEDDENVEDDEEDDDDDTQKGGAGSDDENETEDADENEEGVTAPKPKTKIKKIPAKNVYKKPLDFIDNDDDEDADGEQYLQKFNRSVHENYLLNFHPESISQNYDEIMAMTKVVRNEDGIIIDKLHKTFPGITKYELARILGQRAKQINAGAQPFITVPENVIDGYIIAQLEFKQKKIPFIIRRPLPNGGSEYWKLQDLEDLSF
jgi:DNA-directed RNA polymerase subunit K/omega